MKFLNLTMNHADDSHIPVLSEVVLAGDSEELPPHAQGLDELAPLVERIAARIDRELEDRFAATVKRAVDDALRASLADYQEQVRVMLLRELMVQLPKWAAANQGDADG